MRVSYIVVIEKYYVVGFGKQFTIRSLIRGLR